MVGVQKERLFVHIIDKNLIWKQVEEQLDKIIMWTLIQLKSKKMVFILALKNRGGNFGK